MAPLVESFPTSQLTQNLNNNPATGKPYKHSSADALAVADLKKCVRRELLQYNCDLNGPREDPRSRVECRAVMRVFRM